MMMSRLSLAGYPTQQQPQQLWQMRWQIRLTFSFEDRQWNVGETVLSCYQEGMRVHSHYVTRMINPHIFRPIHT